MEKGPVVLSGLRDALRAVLWQGPDQHKDTAGSAGLPTDVWLTVGASWHQVR